MVYVLLCTDKQDKHHYRKQNQNQRGQAQPGKTLAAEGKHADKAADGQNRVDDALHIQLFAVGFLKHCIVGAGRHQQRNAHHSRSDQQPEAPAPGIVFNQPSGQERNSDVAHTVADECNQVAISALFAEKLVDHNHDCGINKAIAQAIQCAGNNQHKHIGGCCAQNVGEKSYEQAKEQHVAASHPVDQAAAEHAGNCNGNTTNGKNKGVMLLSAQIIENAYGSGA